MKGDVLVKLAKQAIELSISRGEILEVDEDQVPPDLKKLGACFVSVYVNGQLRGCIGSVEAYQPLFLDVIKNAIGAVTRDWRFPPVKAEELDAESFKVEVSVLTPLKKFELESKEDLLEYLETKKPGLMIKKSGRRAVFLPQVWQKLPDPREFLAQLCRKANLNPNDWQEGMEFWVFEVEKFEG